MRGKVRSGPGPGPPAFRKSNPELSDLAALSCPVPNGPGRGGTPQPPKALQTTRSPELPPSSLLGFPFPREEALFRVQLYVRMEFPALG